MTAGEILKTLVAMPTPSGVSNDGLVAWVSRFLRARGWSTDLHGYFDEDRVGKSNLIARPGHWPAWEAGAAHEIGLAFVCHTDTVPYAAGWLDALELEERGGQLHGCGSCDVKGSLACFLAAAEGLAPEQIEPGAALILTADEEIGCKGLERLLAARSLRIGSAIVSEPTSLRPGIAGKGYGLARVTVTGREAHSAFPREGLSAIALAAEFITRMEGAVAGLCAGRDALFDPPHTTVNVGMIEGGTAKNIVSGRCSFLVEWRPIPGEPAEAMLAGLDSLAREMGREAPRARIVVEGLRAEAGFAPAEARGLGERLNAALGRAATGISFGSEASRLARVADQVIVIGPGDMHTAHSDRECVPAAELEEWTSVLKGLLASS